jgi:UDP:flavonoid glycosyltransferase YjiC (YdhE family)
MQEDVLGRADLVVCHGGSGTTIGALAAGLPLVVCPLFADQDANALSVQDAGAGVMVTTDGSAAGLPRLGAKDVASLREAIQRVLGEPAYREAAGRIATEIAALPALDETLERLLAPRVSSPDPPATGGRWS